MWLKVDDGRAVFATHIVRYAFPDERSSEQYKDMAMRYQLEPEGFVAYSSEEANRIAEELKKCGANSVTVESISVPSEHAARTEGVVYASRSKVLAHIVEGREPESLVLSNLRKWKAQAEKKLKELEKTLAEKEARLAALEEKAARWKGGAGA